MCGVSDLPDAQTQTNTQPHSPTATASHLLGEAHAARVVREVDLAGLGGEGVQERLLQHLHHVQGVVLHMMEGHDDMEGLDRIRVPGRERDSVCVYVGVLHHVPSLLVRHVPW